MTRKNSRNIFIFHRIDTWSGFTLTEIVLSIAVLAFAFIPIIGGMGTSLKATTKDERIVQGIHLAQTTLNAALQFPFDEIASWSRSKGSAANGPWTFGGTVQPQFSYPTTPGVGSLALRLGVQGDYTTVLTIYDEPVQFNLMVYSPASRAIDTKNDPTTWNWTSLENYPTPALRGVYQKFVVTVFWSDKQSGQKFYSLVSYKAKLVE